MHPYRLTIRTLLLALPSFVTCYSTGAPPQVCSSLEPGHGLVGREHSELPYKLSLSDTSSGNITITLTGDGFLTSKMFKGFVIQVRIVISIKLKPIKCTKPWNGKNKFYSTR